MMLTRVSLVTWSSRILRWRRRHWNRLDDSVCVRPDELRDWCDKRASNPGDHTANQLEVDTTKYLQDCNPCMPWTPSNGTDYSGTSSGHLSGRLGLLGVFAMLLSVITKRTEHILFRIWHRRTTELKRWGQDVSAVLHTWKSRAVEGCPPEEHLQIRAQRGWGLIVLANHYGVQV